jgi:hypothetical protein
MGQGGQGIWGQARLSYNLRSPDFPIREPPGQATPNLTAARRQDRSRRKTQSGPACESAVNVDRVRVHDQIPQGSQIKASPSSFDRLAFCVLGRLFVRPPAWLFQTAMGTHQPSRQGTPKEKAPLTRGLELLADENLPKSANPWWHAVCGHRRQPEPAPFCSAHRGRSSRCSRGSWARRPPMQAVRASNCRSWFDHSCLKYPVR